VASLDRSVPQVVVGDLNEPPEGGALEVLAAAGLRDALPPGGPGTFHRFSGRRDGPRIDHVLVDGGIEVVHAEVRAERVGRRLASDHWPVVAMLELREG
jgi:endonuclease/exonuclease/phosphatase family metal-dependent hydrolase